MNYLEFSSYKLLFPNFRQEFGFIRFTDWNFFPGIEEDIYYGDFFNFIKIKNEKFVNS